jgi:hypothetical protein
VPCCGDMSFVYGQAAVMSLVSLLVGSRAEKNLSHHDRMHHDRSCSMLAWPVAGPGGDPGLEAQPSKLPRACDCLIGLDGMAMHGWWRGAWQGARCSIVHAGGGRLCGVQHCRRDEGGQQGPCRAGQQRACGMLRRAVPGCVPTGGDWE